MKLLDEYFTGTEACLDTIALVKNEDSCFPRLILTISLISIEDEDKRDNKQLIKYWKGLIEEYV